MIIKQCRMCKELLDKKDKSCSACGSSDHIKTINYEEKQTNYTETPTDVEIIKLPSTLNPNDKIPLSINKKTEILYPCDKCLGKGFELKETKILGLPFRKKLICLTCAGCGQIVRRKGK